MLKQNYPNPFNSSTRISFTLPQLDNISVTIYDIIGKRIKEFLLPVLAPGDHEIIWDGTNTKGIPVSSGVYIYKLQSDNHKVISNKMLLMK